MIEACREHVRQRRRPGEKACDTDVAQFIGEYGGTIPVLVDQQEQGGACGPKEACPAPRRDGACRCQSGANGPKHGACSSPTPWPMVLGLVCHDPVGTSERLVSGRTSSGRQECLNDYHPAASSDDALAGPAQRYARPYTSSSRTMSSSPR